jgi:hypothetical protein
VYEPHTDGKLVCNNSGSGALSLDELISPGSLILVNILSFLDTPTLKSSSHQHKMGLSHPSSPQ